VSENREFTGDARKVRKHIAEHVGTTTPLYIVCSPGRCVGKTLVARLLTEFCVLNSREVVAFYLADEGPQLADYLPEFTTLADISDVFGQVSFFEKLITNNKGAQIADLGLSLLD
jgi:hypothetical protein